MMFLAIEHPKPDSNTELMKSLLKAEAQKTWDLKEAGILRAIYFNENHDAVILLEAADRAGAEQELGSLPLVQANQIRFELMELRPYDGWARLFAEK